MLQTSGIAMCIKMGPSFACVFVDKLEERMFLVFNGPIPDVHKRYIGQEFGESHETHQELQLIIDLIKTFLTFYDLTIFQKSEQVI